MFRLRSKPRSVRVYLALMAVALTLPFFIVACVATMHFANSEAANLESTARENCDELLARLDSEVSGKITFLQTLASSPALDHDGDLTRFAAQTRALVTPDVAIRLIATESRRLLLDTRSPNDLTTGNAAVDLSDAAVRALKERRAVVSNLETDARGQLAGEIVLPIMRDGDIRFLISAVVGAPVFLRQLAGQGISAPYYGAIADGLGIIAARSFMNEQFVGRRIPSLAVDTPFRGANVQGVPVLGYVRKSSLSGWHVATSVELDALNQPLRRSLANLAGLALALCLAGTLLVFVLARRLAQSYGALVAATSALAYGDSIVTPQTAITEANMIGRALAFASDSLRLQATALSTSNHELEHRVTERTQALAAARDRAEAGARAKSEFLANMSHELRTPLTAIVGASDLLLSGYASGKPEMMTRYLEMQREAGNNLLALINDILDFSKIEAGQVHIERIAFSMRESAEAALRLVRDQANRRQTTLELSFDPAMSDLVLGDPTRIGQILINLLSNAVKFTNKGRVDLFCAVSPGGGGVSVIVKDTGIGIAAEKLPGLFNRFSQADTSTTRRYGGSGLGLSITKRLVDLMGGTIGVVSTVGRGSMFTVDVPLTPIVAAKTAPANDEHPPRIGRRILFAEDNAVTREIVATMLRRNGHDVVEVVNGREAVRAVQSRRAFDIILMDIQMPEVDGYEATRFLREHECRLPIIALTANALSDEPVRCLAAGMDLHISKPVDWPRLLDAIDTLGEPLPAAA